MKRTLNDILSLSDVLSLEVATMPKQIDVKVTKPTWKNSKMSY